MTCGSCGAVIGNARRFCGECGAPLVRRCPGCGTVSEPGDRFCGDCGAALDGAEPVRVAVPSPAELRRVSVLFCDLVGFTPLAEGRPAEDVRELLSGYFEVARAVVTRHGGVVEKFIGDAVMAVWGSPVAHEDDAERAVRAALALLAAVTAYGDRIGAPLQARAGVVTGRAASIADPAEGLVVGDMVNTAARVQATAEPGQVLVDAETRQLTAAAIRYVDGGEHQLKGKAEPVHLWRADRVVAGVGGGLRLDGLEAPLVGRARELAVLTELFHGCTDERRARLVVITGQPGTGKSRLLWEFEKHVDGLAIDVLWHTGRCPAYGEGVAFGALAEMVRQRLGIGQDAPRDVVRERLTAGLERWVLDPALRPYLDQALGALLGAREAELSPQELVGGWRSFFEQLAEHGPVVLAFEDGQWADAGLVDFVEQLLDWSADRPLFVVVTGRPELLDARPGLVTGRRNAGVVGLERMADTAVDALLTGLVPDLPERVRKTVVERSEGVPLYAVETVRSLLGRGVVAARDDGTYSLVGEVGEPEVPSTLTALMAARLDALAPAERVLARDLSVLSGSFPASVAEALTDLPAASVGAALAGLVRKDVLGVQHDPHSRDRGQYAFVQSLLRTVAYDTLSRHERRARHLRAAEHLRAAFSDDGEEVVDAIAAHYRDAWAAAPEAVDSAAVREQARAAYERAASRAASLGAPATAERAYRTAADLADDEVVACRLLVAAAGMLDRAGRCAEALELYDDVAARHRSAGRLLDARDLVASASASLTRLSRPVEAEQRLREALRDADPDDHTTAPLVIGLARVATFLGNAEERLPLSDRALALAAAAGDPQLLAEAANLRSMALHYSNREAEAAAMIGWAADLIGPESDYDLRGRVLGNRGVGIMLADLPGAEEAIGAALDAARRAGDPTGVCLMMGCLGELDILHGRWHGLPDRMSADVAAVASFPDLQAWQAVLITLHTLRGEVGEARRLLSRLDDWADSEDVWIAAAHTGALAEIALAEGDVEQALAHGRAAVGTVLRFGFFDFAMRGIWPVAVEAALLAGRLDEVESLLAPVAAAPPGFVPPFLRALLARYRGRLRAARGETGGIEDDLRAAVADLTRLDYPYWRALAQADLADWLDRQDRAEEAAPLHGEAIGTLTSLGARPALRRVQRQEAGRT